MTGIRKRSNKPRVDQTSMQDFYRGQYEAHDKASRRKDASPEYRRYMKKEADHYKGALERAKKRGN